MTHRRTRLFVAALLLSALMTPALRAQDIARADLTIQGLGLEIVDVAITTGVDIPATIQTAFGGRSNDEAQFVADLFAVADLTGPGIDLPIQLRTAPGHRFQLPALPQIGVYHLQNVRLVRGDDEFLQYAIPSFATITVSNTFSTKIRIRQLTAEEIRQRGISIDARNYDVYEYILTFIVGGEEVEIPFPVIVDPRTHQAIPLPSENPYRLPSVGTTQPPRWTPPTTIPLELGEDGDLPSPVPRSPDSSGSVRRPSIPAAIVIPNSIAVLHQFFAVALVVTNEAPAGSSIVLDSVTATIQTPSGLRVVKSEPAVSLGQSVPIVDSSSHATFLIAQAEGSAEWTLEGLRPGTHSGNVEVRATYKSPGQVDFPLKGRAPFSIVVQDPRFHITFSHPDAVRQGIEYSTFAFITNTSSAPQTIRLNTRVPSCSQFGGGMAGAGDLYVCRTGSTPESVDIEDIAPGEMRTVAFRLRPGVTGRVFATGGSVDENLGTASVFLTMGVSESGIPLSPTTLILPHYAQYLDPDFVAANLQLLGLGYSLATAPLSQATSRFPRVIKTDVFHRAVDIARAGQRIFIGEDPRGTFANLPLDLLGNSVRLDEWDALRRQEASGRVAAAALAREIESHALATAAAADDYIARFARVTAWRRQDAPGAQYMAAFAHGLPATIAIEGLTTGRTCRLDSESSWTCHVPYAEILPVKTKDGARDGTIAMIGRWSEGVDLVITPSAGGQLKIDVVFPGEGSEHLEAHFVLEGAIAGEVMRLRLMRNAGTLTLQRDAGSLTAVPTAVAVPSLAVIAARQDLHLDPEGHQVSVLFNRPVAVPSGGALFDRFAGEVRIDIDGALVTKNRPIFAAALQEGSRVANLSFTHALSKNATYSLALSQPLADPVSGQQATIDGDIEPVIDNATPAGILFGRVLEADNTAIPSAEVRLYSGRYLGCRDISKELLETDDCNPFAGAPQFETAGADGSFLFEYVPRDPALGIDGQYRLRATIPSRSTALDGAVRLPGQVQRVNLVFLGRGSAEGVVRYDDGEKVANARVVVGSTLFNQFRTTTADAEGFYRVSDLPVGPLTFSATDAAGNVTYAAAEIRTPSQVIVQDLSIFRRPFPGTGTVRGVVRRSDTSAAVPGARVGVYSQGYGLRDGLTDGSGRFEFSGVPAGFITVLAAEWTISNESVAVDFDLRADEQRDLTLTLPVTPADPLVRVEGSVVREDPLFPGDASKYQKVSGALVKITGGQLVAADPDGNFVFPAVPLSFSGRGITAYDPETTRTVSRNLGTLVPDQVNQAPPLIIRADTFGKGTIRVHLVDAAGNPVTSGYEVFEPGFPPDVFTPTSTPGVWEKADVPLRRGFDVWAVPASASGPYGDQFANGTAVAEFDGHIASVTLRLPGQGRVRAKLRADFDLIGDVTLRYPAWDPAEQSLGHRVRTLSTSENGVAGFATFEKVPALRPFSAAANHPAHGHASRSAVLAFDGDLSTITLQLSTLTRIIGTVYAIDGVTPVSGASVRLMNDRVDLGVAFTQIDGTFEFNAVPAGISFTAIASISQDGIFRTGFGAGKTPSLGGTVDNVRVVLRSQGAVKGRVVYSGFSVFDPANPSNNVADPTPDDPSDNAPVPLARFFLRELDFPFRSFGTASAPLSADVEGRFVVSNIFEGPVRVTTWSPANQELRASWTGRIAFEGEELEPFILVGTEGIGSASVRVRDPNNQGLPVENAEVGLYRGSALFDFATTDANGIARFEQLPAGNYSASGFSKALGRSGSTTLFAVVRDEETEVDLMLIFSGKVSGRMSDPELAGNPGVAGAHVDLTATNYQTRATTAGDGGFVFDGVREGNLRLDAKDPLSNRRATATRTLTQEAAEITGVALELEPLETLYGTVYLPNDTGGSSGIPAPLLDVEVKQRCSSTRCDFLRSAQGNPFQIESLLENSPYEITMREIGGEQRSIRLTNQRFPVGSIGNPLQLVFVAFGSIEVSVSQGGLPASGARVTVSGAGKTITAYTDSSGLARLSGIELNRTMTVQAVSADLRFSASANAVVTRQSVAAQASLVLGDFMSITGVVEAEEGGPSVATRVTATYGSVASETRTDGDGRFTLRGIPVPGSSTSVSLVYLGPDDATIGARQTVSVVQNAAKLQEVAAVKLDATPPRLLSIDPPDGAQDVSPDISLRFVFSEQIDPARLTTSFFKLIPADGSTPLNATITQAPAGDGTWIVTLKPPAASPFPLKSNTLYRVIVEKNVQDLTGHTLPAARGSTFTTSDYAEPRIVSLDPPVHLPIPAATTFRFLYNERIDPAPWEAGGSGTFSFSKVSALGATGGEVKSGTTFVDPVGGSTLIFTPADPIEEQSFYRVAFSGVRDLQGNQAAPAEYWYFSFDSTPPSIAIVAPAAADPLISGSEYTVLLDRGGATDIQKVDYLEVNGATVTHRKTITVSPFSYKFTAPEAPLEGSTLTLRAIATDLSGNVSEPAAATWTLQQNRPPQNVAIALSPSDSLYPGEKVTASVTFEDEGILATVNAKLEAVQESGAAFSSSSTKEITRSSTAAAWPAASFPFDLPPTLARDTSATITATVTDVRGLKTTAAATLQLRSDQIAPEILSTAPAAETRFNHNQKYTIEAVVRDAETGVSRVTFQFDGQTITVNAGTSGVTAGPLPKSWKFVTGQITVPPKNADTRIPIVITAYDYHGNLASQTVEVIYTGVNDPTIPKAAWLCPLDRAALPASQSSFPLRLRVRATDDIAVTGVAFVVPGIDDPVSATRIGTTSDYEAVVTIATPAAGETLSLAAIVSDADPEHDVELPITVELVAVDITVDDRIQAITASDAASYENKTIFVRGSAAKLVPQVPLTLRNLIVLDGARVESLATTTSSEHRIDLTIEGTLYLDCISTIDVSSRGYLGGWGVNADGSNTKNESAAGRTVGNTTTGGPNNASASHGGMGAGSGTNSVYGTIRDPRDLGTGGAGNASCCSAGASGGGAIRIASGSDAGRLVLSGSIRADGGSGVSIHAAGSGGSVALQARQVITGPATRITASGGDDDAASNASRGGGGGRIALVAAERLDTDELFGNVLTMLQARGGRNSTASEGAGFQDGGAGTIFLQRPGQANGELLVSSRDERFPASTHLTRPTPIGTTLVFDRVELGPRALVRFDDPITIAGAVDDRDAAVVDPTAVLLLQNDLPSLSITPAPAAGSSLIQGSSLTLGYTAASSAGIATVRTIFSPAADRVDSYPAHPATASPAPAVQLAVPDTAATGEATLTVRATDRAERSFETEIAAYTIVANAPPSIDAFDLAPASLEIYPGRSVTATIDASDDLGVTKLTLTSRIGEGTPSTQTRTPNKKVVTDELFTVAIPITTPGGQPLTLELGVEDGFTGRAPATASVIVTILKDLTPPSVEVTSPAPDTLFLEGSGNTISVRATAIDAEVGIKEIFVQIDGGTPVNLAPVAGTNDYAANIPVPAVEGDAIVTRQLVVTAKDYEGNTTAAAPITIRIEPLFDPNAPVVRFTCASTGAMYPPGYAAKLRVLAVRSATSASTVAVETVEFFIGDSPAPIAATKLTSPADNWEATWTVPNEEDGTPIEIRAVATTNTGSVTTVRSTVTVVTGVIITTSTTISTDQYDGQTLIVQSGTTTLSGERSFARLVILDAAKVTHVPTDASTIRTLTVSADEIFVSCTGSIDVTGRGFIGTVNWVGRTWPNTTVGGSSEGAGGSHGGRGAATSAASYGSVFDPNTPGGAGANPSNTFANCPTCSPGGGVARVRAGTLHLDGQILANGIVQGIAGGGAGGSIRIDAQTIRGEGEIRADGASVSGQNAGGGGRIALYYTSLELDPTKITAAGGRFSTGGTASQNGVAGTVYLKQESETGEGLREELIVDNSGTVATLRTTLLNFSGASVMAVSGNVITVSGTVLEFVEGSWLEILDGTGLVIASYEIIGRTTNTVTVRLVSGESEANAPVGSAYRNVWRFENITVRNGGLLEASHVRSSDLTLVGQLHVNGSLRAKNLTLPGGSVLTHTPTDTGTIRRLDIEVEETLWIEGGARIDVTGRGFIGTVNWVGRTWPNTTVGGSSEGAGGSHGGRGAATSAASYGSIFDPNTPGGAGANPTNTFANCPTCSPGGGVARVRAGTLHLDGQILAHGIVQGTAGGGAGGSIRIDAQTIRGEGEIRADGASVSGQNAGGGGRIALYYTSLELDLTKITAAGGRFSTGGTASRNAAAGTIYLKQVSASFGDLIVDNRGTNTNSLTALTSVGYRVVSESSENFVRHAGANFLNPNHLVGIRLVVDHDRATTWPIIANDAERVTVDTSEAPLASASGLQFRGLYRLDNLKLRNARLEVVDLLDVVNPIDKDAPSTIAGNNAGPPLLNPSLVVIEGSPDAARVIGSAGTVTDSDIPITVTVMNKRTGASASVTAATDGSFTLATSGEPFDRIVIKARDSHLFPYESVETDVGTLPNIPVIRTALIVVERIDEATGRVAGSASSITGEAPLTVDLRNTATGTVVSGVAVAADGSFTSLIPGSPGNPIELTATNGAGISNGPVAIGAIPFGSSTTTISMAPLTDSNFRARRLAVDGNLMAVAPRGANEAGGNSSRIAFFDITDPASPVFSRVATFGTSTIWDVQLRDKWALAIVTGGFYALDLNTPGSTPLFTSVSGGYQCAAVTGAYAFLCGSAGNGGIRIYDISDPAAPRFIREQATVSGISYRDLIPYGTDYLIGLAPEKTSSNTLGHDVVIIDRRDVNQLAVVADIDIPDLDGLRGRLRGTSLFVGTGSTGLSPAGAVVDLTDPSTPQITHSLATSGVITAVDGSGAVAAGIAGPNGVAFFDISGDSPTHLGTQSIGGPSTCPASTAVCAYDLLFHRGVLYIANQDALVVIRDADVPPMIDIAALSVTYDGTNAVVSGPALSVAGSAPLEIALLNETTGIWTEIIVVDAGGSFTASIPAQRGDVIVIKARDARGRTNGPLRVGSVPIATATATLQITTAMTEAGFRARTMDLDGNLLVATHYSAGESVGSNRMPVFDVTSTVPSWTRTIVAGPDPLYDVDLAGGRAYLASWDFRIVDATISSPAVRWVALPGGHLSVAVIGTRAYGGAGEADGKLRIYDVTDPDAPSHLREQIIVPGIYMYDLLALNETHLVVISATSVSGVGHDVVVLDLADPNNLVTIADLDIPGFGATRGEIVGDMLYLTGWDAGVAIVDLTTPASPLVLSVVDTPGIARDVALARADLLAVADGCTGITYIDISDPSNARVIGTDPVLGNAWAIVSAEDTLYVATEQLLETFTIAP
ncbi:MAG TPA: Ig-like domain-containing protein [Thermoanaerobaculia bacterium]|nr:Ig-like domain-containing protein [Thermoanaerobaculia bacterium]